MRLDGTWHRPKAIDGVSVAGRLSGSAPGEIPPGSPLYWEKHAGGLTQAARIDDWKGVRSGAADPWELYDLKTDAAESTDVAAQHADVVESH